MSYKTDKKLDRDLDRDLDRLKYDIYKKSGLADYITFKQFLEWKMVIQTFGELNKRKRQKKSWK